MRHSIYPILAIALFLPLIPSWTPAMNSTEAPNPSQPTTLKSLQPKQSGIRGKVIRLTGNHMPRLQTSASKKALLRNQSWRSQANIWMASESIRTNVWVFSGRIPGKSPRWAIAEAKQHSKLVGQVRTNAQGAFAIALPPGEYTLFAQDGAYLYLNSFLGDGSYGAVQVEAGKPTEVNLVNSENATF